MTELLLHLTSSGRRQTSGIKRPAEKNKDFKAKAHITIPASFMLENAKTVEIHISKENAIHIMPLALLYAFTSAISSSSTVCPDQNHMGFYLFQAKIPSPVSNALTGTIITSQIIKAPIRFSP